MYRAFVGESGNWAVLMHLMVFVVYSNGLWVCCFKCFETITHETCMPTTADYRQMLVTGNSQSCVLFPTFVELSKVCFSIYSFAVDVLAVTCISG